MNVSQKYEKMLILSLANFYIVMMEETSLSEWLGNIPHYTVSHITKVKL
jgi:hypothetical protein